MKKPIAIFVSDIHLREQAPRSRKDDFWNTQWDKLSQIKNIAENYNTDWGVPIFCSGDLFHHWKPSPELLSKAIVNLPFMYVIPGQHDLPNHNIDLLHKSGLDTLEKANAIKIIRDEPIVFNFHRKGVSNFIVCAFQWGKQIEEISGTAQFKSVAMIHQLITEGKDQLTEYGNGSTADSIMKKAKGFDLIVAGDNHKTFSVKKGNQILINPGSMMRNNIDQIDHKPCVYLWDGEDVEPVYLSIKEDVFDLTKKDTEFEKTLKINAFIEHLKVGYQLGLSFENNMDSFFAIHKTDQTIKNIIYECMGDI